jgi:hypothetical protein
MAVIDLKEARIFLDDGYAGPGGTPAIDNGTGYIAGTSTVVVDGFTGNVEDGDRFYIAGDVDANGRLVEHVVVSHIESTGDTTSITFSPVTETAVVDDAVITMLPHRLEIKIGEGNVTYTESKEFEYFRDRGLLDTVREGDEQTMEVAFDFTWEELTASTGDPKTVEDFLKNIDDDLTSSSADPCEPFSVDVVIENEPDCTDVEWEHTTLPDFRYEELAHDIDAGSVAVSGQCNASQAIHTRL